MSVGGLVLVVDDDEELRDTVCMVLARSGYRAVGARDGNEALECVEGAGAQKFDLLVTDVEMPLLDGVALAQRALKQPRLRVLLMSGFAEQLERAKTLKGSHVAVISKPFTLEEVRASVRKLLA